MTYANDTKFNFEYPELTKIHGEPDYLTILNIAKEPKVNAQSQYFNIIGGYYECLTLVIPKFKFIILPNTAAVIFPVAPPPFAIVPLTTSVQSMVQKSQWESYTRAYLEHIQMQLVLKIDLVSHQYQVPKGSTKHSKKIDLTIRTQYINLPEITVRPIKHYAT